MATVDLMMYDERNAAKRIARSLLELVPAKGSEYEPVFVCVGAVSSTGDALGPLVGWLLKRRGYRGKVIGDLANPVHATNLHERVNEPWALSKMDDKEPWVVGVDAAIGTVGRITVNNEPLRPGAGVGKSLPSVGYASIMASTAFASFDIWYTSLHLTMSIAEVLADAICEFYDAWSSQGEVNVA